MRIRDLRQYVEAICGTSSLESLGQNNDELLLMIHGAKSKVDSIIKSSASFASNAQEQLFYEFVQNAFDANADTLMFNANEDYLMILNNGAPFISTKNCIENDVPGELYSFLAKGKSDKEDKDDNLGQYGQGSKLLYTLISDTGIGDRENKLVNAIKNNRKGPYLISWDNPTQLSNLLLNDENWEYVDPDDYQDGILVCKILYSYYPIVPGVAEEYFSNEEYHKMVKAFDELVDPKRNLNKMRCGTALVIPLGKGQYEAISERENMDNVKRRLGGFVSITNNIAINHNKRLEHIIVFRDEIVQDCVENVIVEFDAGGTHYNYQFAFNPVFANEGYVNFFKYLPIVESKLGLGFIVNSNNFDLDNSRQRINDKSKASIELEMAFKSLLSEIEKSKYDTDNPERFNYLYRCLLETRIPDDEDRRYVKSVFDGVFTDFFMHNILTEDGTYHKFEETYKLKSNQYINNYRIDFAGVGITDKYWVNDDVCKKLSDYHGINIQEIALYDTILEPDQELLSKWILGLPVEEYIDFHNAVSAIKRSTKIRGIKLFRSNQNKLYTAEDIEGDHPIFYFDRTFGKEILEICPDIEYIIGEYEFRLDKDSRRDSEKESVAAMFGKMVANVANLSKTHSHQEFACAILVKIKSVDKQYGVENLAVLRNMAGDVKPFNQLFRERPSGTSILDNFICSYCPQSVPSSWFINTPKAIWDWVESNQAEILKINDWKEYHVQYLSDIVNLHKKAECPSKGIISLYVDNNGSVSNDTPTIPDGFDSLEPQDYDSVAEVFGDAHIVPHRLISYYTDSDSPLALINSSLGSVTANPVIVDKDVAQIFARLDSKAANQIRISPLSDGRFEVQCLDEFHINYFDPDVNQATITALEKLHLHYLPSELLPNYTESARSRLCLYNKDNLIRAIRNASHSAQYLDGIKTLYPLMQRVTDPDVIDEYIKSSKYDIRIDDTLSENDFRWKFIKFAMDKDRGSYIYGKINVNGTHLPEKVRKREYWYNGHKYDCYELIPGWANDNAILEKFLNSIPDKGLFYRCCVVGKEESVSEQMLYQALISLYDKYGVQQMRFLLDYLTNTKESLREKLCLEDGEYFPELLQIILDEGYCHFDDYMVLPYFNPDDQIWANREYILEEERVPEYLEQWLDANPEAYRLFSKLMTDNQPQIRFRQTLIDEGAYIFDKSDFSRSTITSNTIAWILGNDLKFSVSSYQFTLMSQLIRECYDVLGRRLLPRYLDYVEELQDMSECVFSFTDTLDGNTLYLSHDKYGTLIANAITKSIQVKEFFSNHIVCDYLDERLFNKLGLDERKEITVKDSSEIDSNCSEWDDNLYRKWKQKAESRGICIYTTPLYVHRNFVMSTPGEDLLTLRQEARDYGYSYAKYIIVTYPNNDNLSVMKSLERVSNNVEFFKMPFIALQSLYVEQVEELQKEAEKNNTSIEDVIRDVANRNSGKDGYTLSPAMRKLSENMSEEELEAIFENLDKIRDLLNSESELESKVRALIGYIGELIYEHYLQDRAYDYEYSADKGVGEYDFKVKSKTSDKYIYVDVKTNLYSFAGGTVPFYIHSSQGSFLQKHPEKEYHIVRISLKDLDLAKEYERVRYMDDKENIDPRMNDRVRAKCIEIANNYWRRAKIDHFRSGSKEYMIKIERQGDE